MLFFGAKKRAVFYRKLAAKLKNGLRMQKSLVAMRDRLVERRGSGNTMARIYHAVVQQLDAGASFAEAMAPYVTPAERMLLESGEENSDQPSALVRAARIAAVGSTLKVTILKNLQSPLIMVFAAYAFLLVMGGYVVPKISAISDPHKWTGAAAELYTLSLFAQSAWAVILPVVGVLCLVVIIVRLPYGTGPMRAMLDRMPPWSLYRMTQGGSFLIAFAAMANQKGGSSKLTNEKTIAKLAAEATPWLAERLDAVIERLHEGLDIGPALAQTGYEFPDRDIIDDILDYAELDNFADALADRAELWIEESVSKVQGIAGLLQGVMMSAIGLLFVWLVIGINGLQATIGTGNLPH
jgi:type II secretory pathway component PulF